MERVEQSIGVDVLAIKGLGQFERFKAAHAFRLLIENWHVSDFHINLARGSKDAAGYDEHLSITGDNLQLVARNIYESAPNIFQKIIDTMKQRVPGVSDVKPPEKQLYPQLLRELAEEFRSYSERGGQVFVSTHSADFLNAIQLDEVFWEGSILNDSVSDFP